MQRKFLWKILTQLSFAVVVAQLSELSLPTPEIRGLNPNISNVVAFWMFLFLNCNSEKTKVKKKRRGIDPSFKRKNRNEINSILTISISQRIAFVVKTAVRKVIPTDFYRSANYGKTGNPESRIGRFYDDESGRCRKNRWQQKWIRKRTWGRSRTQRWRRRSVELYHDAQVWKKKPFLLCFSLLCPSERGTC